MLISRSDLNVFISFHRSIPLFGLISTGWDKWALFWRFHAKTLISHWDIYAFVSFHRSIPLFGLILTGSEKRALFWRFRAETLISHSDISVFVSFDRTTIWTHFDRLAKMSPVLKVSPETLISCWDIYVLVSFDHSIPLFGIILNGSEKRALFWRFRAETLISRSDISVFVSFDRTTIWTHFDRLRKMSPVPKVSCRNIDIQLRYFCFCKFWSYHYLDSFWPARKNEPCSEGFVQKHWYPAQIFMFL